MLTVAALMRGLPVLNSDMGRGQVGIALDHLQRGVLGGLFMP